MPRAIAISVLLLALTCPAAAGQTADFPYRDDAVRLLKQLMATGYPLDNQHDDGEWLQKAVRYAIYWRDREIESLAIRAAVPLRARVTRPVSSTDHPAAIEVLSYQVLELPQPVPYVAHLETSLDGGPFIEQGAQASGSPGGIELKRLGATALNPGTHHVQIRAHVVFGDAQQPFHSEVRELPSVAYALFDPVAPPGIDARSFIFSPAMFPASTLDPLLPAQPFLHWLEAALSTRAQVADSRMWTSRYCSELTHEHHGTHDAGGICTVIYFGPGAWLGQMWFRTGHVEVSDSGATWHLFDEPSLEALFISDGRAASRLWALPALLEQPAVERRLPAPDIALTPAVPKRGAPAKAVITVRNDADVPVENLLLEVVHVDGLSDGSMRHFVIDIPPFSSKSVSVDVSFRNGYGLIFALPFIRGHGLVHDVIAGDPSGGDCAIHLVNRAAAPREFHASFAHKADCVIR